jgi:hypothetical protein
MAHVNVALSKSLDIRAYLQALIREGIYQMPALVLYIPSFYIFFPCFFFPLRHKETKVIFSTSLDHLNIYRQWVTINSRALQTNGIFFVHVAKLSA